MFYLHTVVIRGRNARPAPGFNRNAPVGASRQSPPTQSETVFFKESLHEKTHRPATYYRLGYWRHRSRRLRPPRHGSQDRSRRRSHEPSGHQRKSSGGRGSTGSRGERRSQGIKLFPGLQEFKEKRPPAKREAAFLSNGFHRHTGLRTRRRPFPSTPRQRAA